MNVLLEKIELFRMAHFDNIPHILKNGITHKYSKNSNSNYITIGDKSLISTLEQKQVNVANGGNKIIKTIRLGDFIPFNFRIKMPMRYVIQHEGNFTIKTLT